MNQRRGQSIARMNERGIDLLRGELFRSVGCEHVIQHVLVMTREVNAELPRILCHVPPDARRHDDHIPWLVLRHAGPVVRSSDLFLHRDIHTCHGHLAARHATTPRQHVLEHDDVARRCAIIDRRSQAGQHPREAMSTSARGV
jgi:hypothetical protein